MTLPLIFQVIDLNGCGVVIPIDYVRNQMGYPCIEQLGLPIHTIGLCREYAGEIGFRCYSQTLYADVTKYKRIH